MALTTRAIQIQHELAFFLNFCQLPNKLLNICPKKIDLRNQYSEPVFTDESQPLQLEFYRMCYLIYTDRKEVNVKIAY